MSCGCNDTALPLANCNDGCADCSPTNTVSLPPCVGGEACDEILFTDCVKFTGSNLPALGINNGDRLLTVLTKLHRVINGLISPTIPLANYTATATVTNPVTTTPFVVSYLGLGPVYNSTRGATSSGATITVGSTTGLAVGMTLEVTAGVGAFTAGTTVSSITNLTTFVASAAPTTALSGGATVITATGSLHQIFTISVIQGTPIPFKAFVGSNVIVSGNGTIA
jgi:hypothetical protein